MLASHTWWITGFPVLHFSENITRVVLQLCIPRCFHGKSAKLLPFYGRAFQTNGVYQDPLLVTAAQDGDLTAQCNFHSNYDAFLLWKRKKKYKQELYNFIQFYKNSRKRHLRKNITCLLQVVMHSWMEQYGHYFFPLMHFQNEICLIGSFNEPFLTFTVYDWQCW